jgi:hypothetical protein
LTRPEKIYAKQDRGNKMDTNKVREAIIDALGRVSELDEKKMDPVGQADADIDNDGDVDDSDKYLHNRRKAIKDKMKEQTEARLSEDNMTVNIDHEGGHDPVAKKHGITLKKTSDSDYAHDATGKKKNLQKYLAHHYDSHEDAKEIHPDVYK